LFFILGFPLPIDAFCDCIPARTSIQALGLLFRMNQTEVFCDTGNVNIFCRMVQPNVNVRRIDMSRMMDRVDMKSLTNAIMMGATKALENIPNLGAKFSFLCYTFCDDGLASDRAQLFSCM
jgi:mannose/fructose/N-acetylgalactosamine-specific phosphotransferase system component IIB